jgi:methylenetetrahydrofolate dehydrogenase (NAD+)
MLANDGATVYSVDIDSIYLFTGGRLHQCDKSTVTVESCVRQSHIVVTGVPTKAYRLVTEWIQPNTTVVNVASFKNVDEDELLRIPGVVYVPQVGKVTVAMLERNLVRLFENFHMSHHLLRKDTPSKDVERVWYGNALQLYTAAAVTALLAVQLLWKR